MMCNVCCLAVDTDGGNHHHQMVERKSNITHRTQVTAFERGWQTIISWLARGHIVDGWRKLLDHFEEIGGVSDTGIRSGSSLEDIHNVEARSTLSAIIVLSPINTLRTFISWGR